MGLGCLERSGGRLNLHTSEIAKVESIGEIENIKNSNIGSPVVGALSVFVNYDCVSIGYRPFPSTSHPGFVSYHTIRDL